jgi:NAD(P)-dependent dehydrogenase (short-subunit alcohol dehydrogenase family)
MIGRRRPPQVVVITGASAGVGRATAIEFAKRGARIGLLARGRAGLDGARRDVEEAGGVAFAVPTDVADAAQVEQAAATISERFGDIDVWVNNAMASVFSPVKEMTAEDFQRVTNVTYLGTVHGTLSALRRMLPRDRGIILQVGSALAYRSIPLQAAYCAAKHAVAGFTDSLRSELIHDDSKVRLCMVQLPAINTPQFQWAKSRMPEAAQPVPPIFQPEVAARAIVWATRHDRREVWVGGSTWQAILGQKLAPGMLDSYLADHGYEAQQVAGKPAEHAENNLMHPLDDTRDYGVHGTFGDRSLRHSPATMATEHRGLLALGGLTIAGMVLAANLRRKRYYAIRKDPT